MSTHVENTCWFKKKDTHFVFIELRRMLQELSTEENQS